MFGLKATEEDLLRKMEECFVDAMIAQPFPGADDPMKTHDRIANLCAKCPGRFFGLASLNLHCDRATYWQEVARCIKDLKFVGIKLHTIGQAAAPLTGTGIPFALPSLRIIPARKYPQLKIVLAHATFSVFTVAAQVAALLCDNIYLETSWCLGEDTLGMTDSIGPGRVMVGPDLTSNIPVEVAKLKAVDLDPKVYAQVMGATAIEVLDLPV